MQKVQGESASSENVMMESKWNKYSQIRVCRLQESEFNKKKSVNRYNANEQPNVGGVNLVKNATK